MILLVRPGKFREPLDDRMPMARIVEPREGKAVKAFGQASPRARHAVKEPPERCPPQPPDREGIEGVGSGPILIEDNPVGLALEDEIEASYGFFFPGNEMSEDVFD